MSEQSTEFYGCRHPAWPDPLWLHSAERAAEWLTEWQAKLPSEQAERLMVVRKQIVRDEFTTPEALLAVEQAH